MSRACATSEGFKFTELDDAAKEAARDWWRGLSAYDDSWYEPTQTDALHVWNLFGFDSSAGETNFSGFCSQGDGASFSARYSMPEASVTAAIKEYAPLDEVLTELAARADVFAVTTHLRFNSGWKANVRRRGSCEHSSTMYVDEIELSNGVDVYDASAEVEILAIARALADWYYDRLETEAEYLDSAECIDEALQGDYRFDEAGHII